MNTKRTTAAIIGFFALLIVVIGWNSITYNIGSGERGVIFRYFQGGLDKEMVFGQGFHMKFPWDKIYIYDVRVKEDVSVMEVLSKNGLTIKAELSYRYKPVDEMIGYLHDDIGPSYHDRIIVPAVRSATREVIGKYLPDELYSTKRESIQQEIFTRTAENLTSKNLVLDAVLIRDIQLPLKLKEAIERKLEQEQASLEYKYKLEKAKQEAERQRIEAEGKAAANKIISNSLTNNILREKGIEATLKLSESPNSKVIVVGSGDDGLPIILGSEK